MSDTSFRVGDWVSITDNNKEVLAFIIRIDQEKKELALQIPAKTKHLMIRSFPYAKKIDSSHPADDLLSLIDIALTTKDEAWFYELSEQLPKEAT